MKAKLLKKLRRKYAKKYAITRCLGGWKLCTSRNNEYVYKSLDEAKKGFIGFVHIDLRDKVRELRDNVGISGDIKYYPW